MSTSLTEISLFLVLIALAVLAGLALIGPVLTPAITQVLAQAEANTASYQTNDLETQVDVMLESYVANESHGASKHADVYTAVSSACSNPDYQLWVRPSKKVNVCFIDGPRVGLSGLETDWR